MAKIERVEIIDDLDGRPIDPDEVNTVEFEVRFPGRRAERYVLDLREANLAKFTKDLGKYTTKATKVTARGGSSPGGRGQDASRNHTIRQWALANGYDLARRGRIPTHIVTAFDAEHS
ncbi:histone-like nucleoid-structuring protein Lsr2 [Gordonia lacunae]|uniref:histone-like nucleoid-structuring protein Lsr2 n=1 Tax=Gordonia lacunae TaxID=417102 RepID=UPI0039E6915A